MAIRKKDIPKATDTYFNFQYGIVKFFNKKSGFGFITGNDGKDYFMHITSINDYDETKAPRTGDDVFFKTETAADGRIYAGKIHVLKYDSK